MFDNVLKEIAIIREQPDTQKRTEMLRALNDSLPTELRLEMPSLVTNAFVRRALDELEERIRSSNA